MDAPPCTLAYAGADGTNWSKKPKKTIRMFGGKANLYKRVRSVLLCRFDTWLVGQAAVGNDPYGQIKSLRREWEPHKVLLCKFKLRSSSPPGLEDTVVPPLWWENVPRSEQVHPKDREKLGGSNGDAAFHQFIVWIFTPLMFFSLYQT